MKSKQKAKIIITIYVDIMIGMETLLLYLSIKFISLPKLCCGVDITPKSLFKALPTSPK